MVHQQTRKLKVQSKYIVPLENTVEEVSIDWPPECGYSHHSAIKHSPETSSVIVLHLFTPRQRTWARLFKAGLRLG